MCLPCLHTGQPLSERACKCSLSKGSLFGVHHEGGAFLRFCNFVFVRCWYYTSIDVYVLKELVSSVWELLSP